MLSAFNEFVSIVGIHTIYTIISVVIAIAVLALLSMAGHRHAGRTKLAKTTEWNKKALDVKVWGASPSRKPLSGDYTIGKRG